MPTQPHSVSLVSQFALPVASRNLPGYFRSKLFVTSSTTNPLVAAAGPLLSLLERLCLSPTLPNIDPIRDNIEHELRAFHSRLSNLEHANEFIMLADYLLCATVDELLGKNYLRLYSQSAEFKAFTPPAPDGSGAEIRFFEIVTVLKQRANQYLDLIELAYYCLITGFEGEHHVRADGRQALDNLIEELHQLIKQHRVNKPHRLFKENQQASHEPNNHKPIILTAALTIAMLVSIYMGSHLLLEHKAKTLIIGHSVLLNMDH